MEVLRYPPYPIITTWDVPSANTQYKVFLEDLVDHSTTITLVTSNAQSQVTFNISQSEAEYDREFLIRIRDLSNNIVVESNLDVTRPYIDYRTLGTTATEIAEYKNHELIARAIIDSIVDKGFYNKKEIFEGVGNGADYYPLFRKVNKVLKIYRNNVLVYDSAITTNEKTYSVTLDHSAVVKDLEGQYNRLNSGSIYLFSGSDDFGPATYVVGEFARGDDFVFVLDAGYKTVPADVEQATKMLIEDLKCGRLDYYKRYVTSYNTDQFKIQVDKRSLDGTGNILVDKILSKYIGNINRPGVL